MSQGLHVGLSIGVLLLGVGVLVGVRESVGIMLIIVGVVWTVLSFVPNPLRKRFWVNDKIVVLVDDIELGSNQTDGFPKLGHRILKVGTRIKSIYEERIDSISVKMCGKKLHAFEPKGHYLYFDIPSEITVGVHKAYIVVGSDEGFSKSKSFQIDIPRDELSN